jgi:hypothetical protein
MRDSMVGVGSMVGFVPQVAEGFANDWAMEARTKAEKNGM